MLNDESVIILFDLKNQVLDVHLVLLFFVKRGIHNSFV